MKTFIVIWAIDQAIGTVLTAKIMTVITRQKIADGLHEKLNLEIVGFKPITQVELGA